MMILFKQYPTSSNLLGTREKKTNQQTLIQNQKHTIDHLYQAALYAVTASSIVKPKQLNEHRVVILQF